MTKRTKSERGKTNGAIILAATAALFAVSGCKALEEHKCCLFSEDGIFASKKPEVDRATAQDERDALARAAVATDNKKEAWNDTDAENGAARKAGIDLNNFVWTTQRPNGGALFPKQWQGPGPALVVEPATIAAPVGSDVIVVASYIGEDSEYLRVGEQLNWSMSGIGKFMESNPNEFANGQIANIGSRWRSNGSCLSCLTKTSRDVEERSMTTSTTGQLWRINRGTDTQLDDVTILRGQSWASVSAFEEGTSTIVVMSDTIGNWNKRRAVSEIHWIDAAFRFPESGVSTVKTSRDLTTTVVRRTTSEPREGWKVRYDVLSGDAGVGPNNAPSVTVTTDANGNATTQTTQLRGEPGTAKISATIIRPATETAREVEVDSKTIFQTWSASGAVTMALVPSTTSANVGETVSYRVTLNNLSDFYQNATVEVTFPTSGIDNVNFPVPPQREVANGVQWDVATIAPRKSTSFTFSYRKTLSGATHITGRVVRSEPTSPPRTQNGQPNSAPAQQPQNDGVPPVISPSADPASVQPSLQR